MSVDPGCRLTDIALADNHSVLCSKSVVSVGISIGCDFKPIKVVLCVEGHDIQAEKQGPPRRWNNEGAQQVIVVVFRKVRANDEASRVDRYVSGVFTKLDGSIWNSFQRQMDGVLVNTSIFGAQEHSIMEHLKRSR